MLEVEQELSASDAAKVDLNSILAEHDFQTVTVSRHAGWQREPERRDSGRSKLLRGATVHAQHLAGPKSYWEAGRGTAAKGES